MKLWSYGDSHAAGHELGYVTDRGLKWLKENYDYNSRLEAKTHLKNRYTDVVRNHWYNYLTENFPPRKIRNCDPSLSYAGKIANHYNAELVNRAVPGASNDMIAYRMLDDMQKWNHEDLILSSVVTPYRFMPEHDMSKTNYQLHWLDIKKQRNFLEIGPSYTSFKLWNQGLLHLIKSLHSNVKMIATVELDIEVNNVNTSTDLFSLNLSMSQFAANNFSEDMRYLGGHFDEKVHEAFAEYIINESK
jgi:hypothetical protein